MNIDTLPNITIGKYRWWGTNHQELLGIKHEIFHQHIYNLDLTNPSPVIIDAGAHVGLATLYFKLQYPGSAITCVEPHPHLIKILNHNLWFNQIENVNIIGSALDDKAGQRPYYFDSTADHWYSTAGFINGAWDQTQTSASITVPTISLGSLINRPVDLLKMDIETAETDVLVAAKTFLSQINHLIIECHQKNPHNLLSLLRPTHQCHLQSTSLGLYLIHAQTITHAN